MPQFETRRPVKHSPDRMYALVADIERYPEFLPWVIATRVKSDSPTEMVADMVVGFKAIREKFPAKVAEANIAAAAEAQRV